METYEASHSLESRYINRKVSEANYSILIGLMIFAIVGTGFYFKLDSLPLLFVNLFIIAIPISIYVYMSTFKQANNVITIISKIDVTDTEYKISSYSFKSRFLFFQPVELTVKKGRLFTQKVAFPYNEDGLESDKKDVLRIIINGKSYYLLYKYFPASLLNEF
ncbi:hypothetical protein FPZ43_09805 [Mucilaginibacter pallidiroseus]|uniref:Uncharacterized protein n=1 Tax=Mucilaginibacter pallidiroseus TaxID=2599295 RepID=A0A563UCZ7_9SPHI|nr:hypothetical protein [Mucilaginibacter pallidiroseus]TWR29252.1 hypothetical protein FPZ43_09805 [Mucilaginibacter pallidiroseus]